MVRLCLVFVCISVRAAFSLTERGEMRGEPESSQRTVPPELSRPGKRDVHNNVLVPSARAHAYLLLKNTFAHRSQFEPE